MCHFFGSSVIQHLVKLSGKSSRKDLRLIDVTVWYCGLDSWLRLAEEAVFGSMELRPKSAPLPSTSGPNMDIR